MGRTLIVAEKPAQAREYARTLGVRGKRDGFLENEHYVITWCFGHLMELERPEAYMDLDQVGRRWSLQRLPVLPDSHEFRRVVKASALKQYRIIEQWLKAQEIEQVICGTDADREGQLLFQEVWDTVGCQKPLARLWVSSLTAEAIQDGLNRLRWGDSVAGLAAAGYGRSFADWDFGMNLTEGFTALFGSFDPVRKKPNVISIGRVQTPTLALIVEREWEIERFIAEPYFEVLAEFTATQGNYAGKWFKPGEQGHRLTDRRVAEAIVAKTQGNPGNIVKLEQKEVSEPPPLLFDLTSLTITASKRYNLSAERVLQVAQSLYEKKAITYPRTDCPYLPADLIVKLPAHLQAVRQGPYLNLAEEAARHDVPGGKRVIQAISAHHAIIPTTEKAALARLTAEERKLYDLIVRRFLAIWFPAARFEQTEVVTEVASEPFRTKGKVLLSQGWKQVYAADDEPAERTKDGGAADDENAALPPLKVGEAIQTTRVYIEEKTTKPPKRFTQGDLLKAMETAGKQIDNETLRQQLKGKGLGTVATRPAILGNLLERGYIVQEQKVLKATPKGSELIRLIREQLPQARLLISAEMTGQMEFDLARVEKGELDLNRFMFSVAEAIGGIIEELRSFERIHGKTPLALGPSGVRSKTGTSRKAGAVRKAGETAESDIGRTKVSRKRRQAPPNNLTAPSENQNTITARADPEEVLHSNLESASPTASYRTTNIEPRTSILALGICPRCGGTVIEGKKGYGCANWRAGCGFVVWKNPICGKVLTPNQMKSLLKKGKTPLIKGFKAKNGQSFAAYLIWEDKTNGTLKFEFVKK